MNQEDRDTMVLLEATRLGFPTSLTAPSPPRKKRTDTEIDKLDTIAEGTIESAEERDEIESAEERDEIKSTEKRKKESPDREWEALDPKEIGPKTSRPKPRWPEQTAHVRF